MVRTYVYYKKNDLSEIPATKEIKVKEKDNRIEVGTTKYQFPGPKNSRNIQH